MSHPFSTEVLSAGDSLPADLLHTYREAFAGPPWNEGRTCPRCTQVRAGLDESHCCWLPPDLHPFYWTDEKIQAKLSHSHQQGLIVVARDRAGEIVGLASAELTTIGKLREILEAPELMPEASPNDKVFYLVDMAVRKGIQRKGVGRLLSQAREEAMAAIVPDGASYPVVVRVRESPEPSGTFVWYMRDGARVIFRYSDGRRILRMPRRMIGAPARSAA